MGNSASQLPYSIDNQVGAPHDHNGWALHNGKSTDATKTEVTVFVGKKPQLAKLPISPRFPQKTQLVPALHHYNHCRKLRHPHVLKVLATLDTDNPTAASTEAAAGGSAAAGDSSSKTTTGDLIIVTEPCISLTQWLLSKPGPEELAWGLECIIAGLHFLHASAKLAHGNLSPASFYVTKSGDVKLWNFSLMTQIGPNLGPSNHFREWEASVTPESYRSPERVQQNYSAISQAGIHAMDSYALGILIDHWFSGQIPAVLQKAVQRLQTPSIKMRPRLQPLLKCPVFDTPYQKLQKQFEEIQIQPIEQKVALWQNLGLSMQAGLIPEDLSVYKVLPLIQSSIQTTCTNDSMISQDLYRREILAMITPLFFICESYLDSAKVSGVLTPLVAMLFKVKDRGVRGALLNKVQFMSAHLDKSDLNASVFEPLCSGFNDSSPALRELTLKATLGLVHYLNAPNMEKLSRYLVRLQSDTETAIRANAVIFIAKIAPSLSDIAREKMLLPAYARSMKDTFPPCRLEALKSLQKSKDLFSMSDLANKVLPTTTPLLLDPITDVRKAAFEVTNGFMRSLEQESDRLAHLAQRQAAAGQQVPAGAAGGAMPTNAMSPSGKVAPNSAGMATPPTGGVTPAPSSGSYLSGFSSWMSSSAKPDAATAPGAPRPPAPTPVPRPVAPATKPVAPAPAAIVPPVQQMATTRLSAPAADDGWGDDDGDDDGWGDDDDDDAMEDPFANIGTKTTAAKPVAAPMNSFAASPGFGGGASNDDDPFAAIGLKPASGLAANRPKGKLVLPKKASTPGSGLKLAPATKLTLSDDEMGDGWDDF